MTQIRNTKKKKSQTTGFSKIVCVNNHTLAKIITDSSIEIKCHRCRHLVEVIFESKKVRVIHIKDTC